MSQGLLIQCLAQCLVVDAPLWDKLRIPVERMRLLKNVLGWPVPLNVLGWQCCSLVVQGVGRDQLGSLPVNNCCGRQFNRRSLDACIETGCIECAGLSHCVLLDGVLCGQRTALSVAVVWAVGALGWCAPAAVAMQYLSMICCKAWLTKYQPNGIQLSLTGLHPMVQCGGMRQFALDVMLKQL